VSVITDRVPVSEISRQAREVHFGAALLALVTGVLFGAGWLVSRLFGALWLTLAWAATATRLGWQHAQGSVKPPRAEMARALDDLANENERLRTEVARLSGG
jgi:hypothetical protein